MLHAAPLLLLHGALLLRCRSAAQLLLLAKLQQHLGACRSCSLLGFSPSLRPGRKTKDASRSVTCASACLGCVSMCRCSGLMSRAALCLEGHWVKMRPGAAVMAHQRRRMAVGCHRPRAQRGTSCCAVTGASSAALRGGECLPPHIFPRREKEEGPPDENPFEEGGEKAWIREDVTLRVHGKFEHPNVALS